MDRTASTLTDDGWRIALRVYEPAGNAARRNPVILCHGLAASHLGFDVDPDTSLARHLASRGYLVFALDLRGHGDSERPTRRGPRRFGWSFDDYLLRDLPAAVAYAKRVSGAPSVHWIGHSMGGLLAYAHLARGGSRDFCSVTAVGSSLDYSGAQSGFHALLPLLPLLDRVPFVPVGLLARAMARVPRRVETPFARFNVWRSNVDPEHWRRVSRQGFHAVSAPVMAQLASAMQPGGLRSRDGSTSYVEGLSRATAPVLAIAGDRDAQCPPDAAERTLAMLGSPRRQLRVFGTGHGEADHYGHFDLVIGRRARTEVFPCIDAWLDAADEAARGTASMVGPAGLEPATYGLKADTSAALVRASATKGHDSGIIDSVALAARGTNAPERQEARQAATNPATRVAPHVAADALRVELAQMDGGDIAGARGVLESLIDVLDPEDEQR